MLDIIPIIPLDPITLPGGALFGYCYFAYKAAQKEPFKVIIRDKHLAIKLKAWATREVPRHDYKTNFHKDVVFVEKITDSETLPEKVVKVKELCREWNTPEADLHAQAKRLLKS